MGVDFVFAVVGFLYAEDYVGGSVAIGVSLFIGVVSAGSWYEFGVGALFPFGEE